MNCLQCGKEIPDGLNRLCESCSSGFLSKPSEQKSNQGINKGEKSDSHTEGAHPKATDLPSQDKTTGTPEPILQPKSGIVSETTQTNQTTADQLQPEVAPTDPSSKESKVFINQEESGSNSRAAKKFPIRRVVLAVVITLIFLGVFGPVTLVLASYSGWDLPLVPKGVMRFVDNSIASAPLLPKTPKQILTRALFKTNEIDTAYQKASFKMDYSGVSPSESFEFFFDLEGPFDATQPEDSKYKATVKGGYKLGGEKLDLKFAFIQIGNDLYFNLKKAPDILKLYGYNFSSVQNKWYKFNYSELQGQLSTTSESDEEVKKESEDQLAKFIEIIEERQLLKKFEMLPDEKVGDKNSYHLKLALTSRDVRSLILDFSEEFGSVYGDTDTSQDIASLTQVTNYLKNTTLELWVTKKDFIVNKADFKTSLVLPSSVYSSSLIGKSLTMNFQFGYSLEQINEPQKIDPPAKFKDIDDPMEFFMKIYDPSDGLLYSQPTSVLGATTVNVPTNVVTITDLAKAIYFLGPSLNQYGD
jgi:hypothetical protein